MLKQKTYIGIIIFLVFVLFVSFYIKDDDNKQYQELLKEIEDTEQKNSELHLQLEEAEKEKEEVKQSLVKEIAKGFKYRQFDVNFSNLSSFSPTQFYEEMYKKFNEYATEDAMEHLLKHNAFYHAVMMAEGTRSNLRMSQMHIKDLKFESEEEVVLFYDVDIEFERLDLENQKQYMTNPGILRLILTDDGWKVNIDEQRMRSLEEVKEHLNQQE
ncbi:hypothetical protein [Salinibacillus xinjiangensis]|uniref:Uncharacterized protein n=1 Tax=Salinibacillus xinjiangensis TaxID=1229268 RepID=A0A6G1X9M3_9BACI|nr:hypothetical protein [Salinibacillus xinjiangensis]MRG87605.1 hypothetical protein [Salinibacillus xinjiangensis]